MSLIDELKQIDIVSFLSSRGYKPIKETNSKIWYNSPLRPESSPSFYVKKDTNRWRDFGFVDTKTHSIIDLVEQMDGVDTLQAMSILKSKTDGKRFEPIEIKNDPVLTVLKVYDHFIDARLLMYLKSRGITKNVYERYTKEIHYCFSDKPEKVFSAVGFKNDSGGWEVRNSYHKYCISPKTITTFDCGSNHTLNLFEGFINGLSYLCYNNINEFDQTTIVLNGLGNLYKILPEINKYEKINCYLDWGCGGSRSMDMIRGVVGTDRVMDHRYLYEQTDDFNDLLIKTKKL